MDIGLWIDPGRANTSRPWLPAIRAVIRVPLFSPARFKDGQRSKANAMELGLFVLDVDNGHMKDKHGEWVDGAVAVTGRHVGQTMEGYQFALATSWSHTPRQPKFRVVMPLLWRANSASLL